MINGANFKGKKKAELVAMLEELFCCDKPRISDSGDVAKIYRSIVGRKKQEHFLASYLDGAGNCIRTDVLFIGTINRSLVHPREVFAPAIELRAVSVIIGHNHPSGSVEPSTEDINMTKRLVDAGRILGIEIADHVVFTNTHHYSFRGNGHI
jgi:DNA repair protein RadC